MACQLRVGKAEVNIVRAGINYKFDWFSPIIAKY
jgi:hypothetical protein